ncbi:WD repeat-containing protein, partial [Reticulomyxa filosa]
MISLSYDEKVRIWHVELGEKYRSFDGHGFPIYFADFSSIKNIIVLCPFSNTINLVDLEPRGKLITLKGHEGPVVCVDVSLDGKYIVSSSKDKTIRLWDIHSKKKFKNSWPSKYCRKNSILSFYFGYTIDIWDVKTGKRLKQLKGHSDFVRCARFSPDGQFVISCSLDKTMRIWNVESGKEMKALTGHSDYIND